MSDHMTIQTLSDIQDYLHSFIPHKRDTLFRGDWGLEQVKFFLETLGNPQEQMQVIHIAGTSAKGSTATIISQLLSGQGNRTGLFVSPYLVDMREAFQIDNLLPDEDVVVAAFQQFCSALEKFHQTVEEPLSYYEILNCFSFYFFAQQRVDYAVIETNLGGLLDCTNVVSNPNKVCVITKIGYDHQKVLGNTLEEISAQKIGIVQPGNRVFICHQEYKEAEEALIAGAHERRASSYDLLLDMCETDYPLVHGQKVDFELGLQGDFHKENFANGLYVALQILGDQVDVSKLRDTARQLTYPGRYEKMQYKDKTIILDGAHNPQKLKALVHNLQNDYPGQRFPVLFSILNSRTPEHHLIALDQIASEYIYTTLEAHKVKDLKNHIEFEQLSSPAAEITFIPNHSKALEELLAKNAKACLITGSLYLISSIRPLLLQKITEDSE
jgi:dihydrofolate synthase/folylpolyglutamate synthase